MKKSGGTIWGYNLTQNIILFSHRLRERGFKSSTAQVMDCLKCLTHINTCSKADFFNVLRANLVTNKMEWEVFQEVFKEYWSGLETEDIHDKSISIGDVKKELIALDKKEVKGRESVRADIGADSAKLSGTYSPLPSLERKDISLMDKEELRNITLYLNYIISQFRLRLVRRYKRGGRESLDIRKTFRRYIQRGGELIEIYNRRRKKKLRRLIVFVDISGSMERYARFLIPFILAVGDMSRRIEIFLFSTSLCRVTDIIRRKSQKIEKTLTELSYIAPDWSGGTRIGYSLYQFNTKYANSLLDKKSIVIILSDGWDLGAKRLLEREISKISDNSHSIIWLNPLLGDPNSERMSSGMRVALPYVKYSFRARSIEDLRSIGKALSRLL